tara:strand:- start:40 stop:243 length:204 start_codon:yes stop_codon:yes gene_type:complete
MKSCFKPDAPVSPYSDDLVAEYLRQGLTVKHCLDGESGGLTHIIKSMMNPKARRMASRNFNERRVVA